MQHIMLLAHLMSFLQHFVSFSFILDHQTFKSVIRKKEGRKDERSQAVRERVLKVKKQREGWLERGMESSIRMLEGEPRWDQPRGVLIRR